MRFLALTVVVLVFSGGAIADANVSPKHVIYLHGAIIENGDPKPIHPEFGLYDYPAIISILSSFDFHLIAERRAKNTDYLTYAQKVSDQVNGLIAEGASPQDITVIGFSKGAAITAIASSLLKNDDVNFVIMANCGEWYETETLLKGLRLRGHILSVYEESDSLGGSCQKLAQRSPAPTSFTEVVINTGKLHGAFFSPRKEWVNPVISWINRNTAKKGY